MCLSFTFSINSIKRLDVTADIVTNSVTLKDIFRPLQNPRRRLQSHIFAIENYRHKKKPDARSRWTMSRLPWLFRHERPSWYFFSVSLLCCEVQRTIPRSNDEAAGLVFHRHTKIVPEATFISAVVKHNP